MDEPEDRDEGRRPPWWFLTAIWGALAGTAAAIAAAIGLISSQ